MARRRCGDIPSLTVELHLALLVGPADGEFPEEELEAAWLVHHQRILDSCPDWTRPWGWWKFEQGEEHPEDERARLAELGEV